MSSDDQYFLDLLSSIPNDVKKYSGDIAESIDRHFESVALSLRKTLQGSPWFPDSIKPPPRPSPHVAPPFSQSHTERAQTWISRNRALTAAAVAFIGTGLFIIWRRRRSYHKKRRAQRAANGARTEVVVLAGSPQSALTRSIALDLERRGFIVYIPTSTLMEERFVQAESRADIHPLHLDITSPSSTQETISRFENHMSTPQHPLPNTPGHNLHFAGFILLPSPEGTSQTGPLTILSPSIWSDTLNTQLLAPFTTLQIFLPLLTAVKSTILILTPSIVPSLNPPFHAPESTVAAAMTAYARTLRAEVSCQGVRVSLFKIGAFDYSSFTGASKQLLQRADGRDVHEWDAQTRAQYAREYLAQQQGFTRTSGKGLKGSSLRELHMGIFDALTTKAPAISFFGRGSRAYDLVGAWMPDTLVNLMLRERRSGPNEQGSKSDDWENIEAGYESVYGKA